jgi:Ca2+-binding EF-hand superfamily protein
LGGLAPNIPSANGVVASSANVMRAYRIIQLNKHDMKSFNDNVFQAYTYLEKDHGISGVRGFDFIKLARMLCVDYNSDIVKGILAQLDKREEENVDFDDFLCGIRTILMYDSYFEEMETVFRQLDFLKRNRIRKDDLIQAAIKLRDEAIGPHELRIPSASELERIYFTL